MELSWEHLPLTGDLQADVTRLLTDCGCRATVDHSHGVVVAAGRLARQFGAGVQSAETAGWLHDVSAVIPLSERVDCARRWGVEVLPEEAGAPMILHQKLSAWMAAHTFGVTDARILSAIGCHTTLKRDAGVLDKVLFVADKMAWDQPGVPPYLAALEAALAGSPDAAASLDVAVSLDAAVCVYLDYLWQQRERLAVVHPWFVAAYRQLCADVEETKASAPTHTTQDENGARRTPEWPPA